MGGHMIGTSGPPGARRAVRGPRHEGSVELARAAAARFGRPELVLPAHLLTDAAWDGLPAAANVHRLPGSVLCGVADHAGVPDRVRSELADAARRAATWNLMATHELLALAGPLDAAGVRWLVQKGPAVANHLYRDGGARAYWDIDLMVHPADLEVATVALEDVGYEHLIRNWPLHRWFGAGEFPMRREPFELDVHWHVLYARYDRRSARIDLDAVFDRTRRIVIGGTPVPTFGPVDTLLFLALHASKSGGHRLVWSKDIERAITVDRPDLDELVRTARAFGCGPRVGLPLARAASSMAADVPREVVRALVSGPMRAVDSVIAVVSPPVRSHERDTLSRRWMRSLRGSAPSTAADVVRRGWRNIRPDPDRPPFDESGDPVERARYLRAAARAATTRPERWTG